jgi:hypothetical protein
LAFIDFNKNGQESYKNLEVIIKAPNSPIRLQGEKEAHLEIAMTCINRGMDYN